MIENKSWKRITLLPFLLFFLSVKVFADANEEKIAHEIRKLLIEKKIKDANDLALFHRDNLEGSSSFDYAMGLTQRANGELNQAVFTFERVLQFKPNQIDSLYMLAVSYYELGNLEAAKKEFSRLSELALPNNIDAIVENYLLSINHQQKRASSSLWRSSFQLGVGNDSNPNNGIVDEFITIPAIGDIRVFDENRELSSNFYNANGQIAVTSPITQKSKWFATASVLQVEFGEELALSRTFVDTRLGYLRDLGQFKLSSSVYYQPVRIAGDSFLENTGLNIGVKHPFYFNAIWGGQISYAQQKYTNRPLLNRDQLLANLWLETPFIGGTQRFTLRYGDENADHINGEDFIGRELFGLGYQWSKQISSHWGYKLSINHLISKHNGVNPLFEIIREDDFTRAELELRFKPSTGWLLLARFSHIDNNSETPIFRYQRSIVSISARFTF